MKKTHLIICLAGLVLMSCNSLDKDAVSVNEKHIEDGVEEMDSITPEILGVVDGQLKKNLIYKGDTSVLIFDYAFYSEIDFAYKDSVNSFIRNRYKRDNGTKSSWDSVNINEGLFRDYLQTFSDEFYEFSDGEDEMIWSLECYVSIDDSRADFVELDYGAWSYEGGAHGNGFSQTLIFNKEDGQRLTLDYFFTDIGLLTRKMETVFRKNQGLDSDEDLDEAGFMFRDNKFHLQNNFTFSDQTFIVYYNSYDIAPYVFGPTEIRIPLSEIKHLLKRDI